MSSFGPVDDDLTVGGDLAASLDQRREHQAGFVADHLELGVAGFPLGVLPFDVRRERFDLPRELGVDLPGFGELRAEGFKVGFLPLLLVFPELSTQLQEGTADETSR
jgi:hypothetical protein